LGSPLGTDGLSTCCFFDLDLDMESLSSLVSEPQLVETAWYRRSMVVDFRGSVDPEFACPVGCDFSDRQFLDA
jgi:hypothetical protein